jgi:SNF2 family DNA or RNA helicase
VALVVNFDALRSKPAEQMLRSRVWDLVVFDEAQKIKAPRGSTSKAAARVARAGKRVIGLSGTPMPHSPMDVWAQMRAIDPGLFGPSYLRFRAEFAIMGGYKNKQVVGFKNEAALQQRLGSVMYSPPADAVQLNLPDARHEIVRVQMAPKARKLYDALQDDLVAEIDGGTINAANGLVKLLRLQQLCSGLAVTETSDGAGAATEQERLDLMRAMMEGRLASEREEVEVCTAKRDALADILGATDEPIVVFGQFRRDMDCAREAARLMDTSYAELSGHADDLAYWKAGGARVLGVQIASGAEGIDLTRARICCYMSTGFNLGQYLQSVKRVHRPGQNRAVVYYHIHAERSVDEVVWGALQKREDLVSGVLAGIRAGEGSREKSA